MVEKHHTYMKRTFPTHIWDFPQLDRRYQLARSIAKKVSYATISGAGRECGLLENLAAAKQLMQLTILKVIKGIRP